MSLPASWYSVFFYDPIFKEGEIKTEMLSRPEVGEFLSLLLDPAVRQVLLEPPARVTSVSHTSSSTKRGASLYPFCR